MEHRAPWLWRRLVSYINRHEQKSTFCDETPPLHFPLWRKLFHPILLNSLISVMMSWPNFGGESPLFNRPGAVRRVRQFSPSRRLRCKFERVILFELIHQSKLSSRRSKFSNFNFFQLDTGKNRLIQILMMWVQPHLSGIQSVQTWTIREHTYFLKWNIQIWDKSLWILLSRTQAGQGRTGEQEEEEILPNLESRTKIKSHLCRCQC